MVHEFACFLLIGRRHVFLDMLVNGDIAAFGKLLQQISHGQFELRADMFAHIGNSFFHNLLTFCRLQ